MKIARFFQVTVLPEKGWANAVYFVLSEDGTSFRQFVTDDEGTPLPVSGEVTSIPDPEPSVGGETDFSNADNSGILVALGI